MNYNFKIDSVWYDLIKLGKKKVEGRLNKGEGLKIVENDFITFTSSTGNKLKARVARKTTYKSFKKYLVNEGLRNTLPGIYKLRDGRKLYYKYYTRAQEDESGVVTYELANIEILHKEEHDTTVKVPVSPLGVASVTLPHSEIGTVIDQVKKV